MYFRFMDDVMLSATAADSLQRAYGLTPLPHGVGCLDDNRRHNRVRRVILRGIPVPRAVCFAYVFSLFHIFSGQLITP